MEDNFILKCKYVQRIYNKYRYKKCQLTENIYNNGVLGIKHIMMHPYDHYSLGMPLTYELNRKIQKILICILYREKYIVWFP